MKKAEKHICSICGQEQDLTLDNELVCSKCGYIKKLEDDEK